MRKPTLQQIKQIDAALLTIGIMYIDIRLEMTDHIASELECIDGDFDENLTSYITCHKKQLRRQSTKSVMVAWLDSWKTLVHNLFTFRFVGIVGSIFIFLLILYLYVDLDTLMPVLILSVCVTNASFSIRSLIPVFKNRDMYSTGEGLGIANLLVFFPGIIAANFVNDWLTDVGVLLYFTALISVSLALGYTMKSFKGQIKLKYHG